MTAQRGTWICKPRGQWHTFWNAGTKYSIDMEFERIPALCKCFGLTFPSSEQLERPQDTRPRLRETPEPPVDDARDRSDRMRTIATTRLQLVR